MGGGSGSRTDVTDGVPSIEADEDALLDKAMLVEADPWLLASLREDELRRRHRRWVLGGIAMITVATGVIVGLLWAGAGIEATETAPAKANTLTETQINKAGDLVASGWKAWQNRDFATAVGRFEAGLAIDPTMADGWNGLGWALFSSGKSSPAEEAFLRCLALAEKHPAALNGLGQVYFLRRDYKRAEPALLEAVANGATAPYYALTRLYLLQGKFDEAAKWSEDLAKQSPDEPLVAQMVAAVKIRKVDAGLRQQIEPRKPMSSDRMLLGWVQLSEGKTDQAVKTFSAVAEAEPDDVSAQYALGCALLDAGKADQAKVRFEQCLTADPHHVGAKHALATLGKDVRAAAATDGGAAEGVLLAEDFEAGGAVPDGWRTEGKVPGVRYIYDKKIGYKSKGSLCLKKTENRYFPIAQWVKRVRHEGDAGAIELSAWVKASKAHKAILDVLFLDANEQWIRHEWVAYIGAKEANDPPVTHHWKAYAGKVDIPDGTEWIVVGLQIYGPGTVWFDDVTAKYVD